MCSYVRIHELNSTKPVFFLFSQLTEIAEFVHEFDSVLLKSKKRFQHIFYSHILSKAQRYFI